MSNMSNSSNSSNRSNMSDMAKLALAVFLDILDFTVGRAIGAGAVFDLALAGIAFLLWGWPGLIALWELVDPSEQIDGFVPTLTLIALSQMGRNKRRRGPAA